MKTLDEIGLEHKTDKSSTNHHYLSFYDLLFSHLRCKPSLEVSLLEIGVQFGNSLRTWRDYFNGAVIIGIDSVNNGVQFPATDLVYILYGDAYHSNMLNSFRDCDGYDIIIDDGSHAVDDQIFVLQNYLPLLKPTGILIIEDVLKPETIGNLALVLPEGYLYTGVEMNEGDSMVDSRLFITWKPPQGITGSVSIFTSSTPVPS